MNFDGELITHTVSLTQVHMSQAIDTYLRARDEASSKSKPYGWIQSTYNSISSIMHSYSAMESVISGTGHQVFFEDHSDLYVSGEKRNFALTKVINNWKYASCLDKLNIIIEQISQNTLPSKLTAELSEFNNLRNWLFHGFVYKSTLLLEKHNEEEGTFTLVDREDSVDWERRFPNTKFSALDNLSHGDAKKALLISLSVINFIYRFRKEPFSLLSYYYGPYFHLIGEKDRDAATILEEYFQEAYNKSLNKDAP